MKDPNPIVSGRGIEILRKNGIEVVLDVMKDEAEKLNEVFNEIFIINIVTSIIAYGLFFIFFLVFFSTTLVSLSSLFILFSNKGLFLSTCSNLSK